MTKAYSGGNDEMMKNQAKWSNYYQKVEKHERMIQRFQFLYEKVNKQRSNGPALLTPEERLEYEYLQWYDKKVEHHPKEPK